ncbi:hypothetical protein AXG93_4859s1020 [Marchantia polymorpha subsp. ruderalis]|uniref:Plastocyanin-like domain-containing protein n=1 Tax=Marchantia polymorpha subsp. ruderalis TaxID=1480154 RepID=A0A176WBT8_MARPO|nr:hypothetical protein AXG93_4859s1020 [Marchantia polymorpha subsp. ruderalis]
MANKSKTSPTFGHSSNSIVQIAILVGFLCSLPVIQGQDVHSQCGNLTASPPLTPFVVPLTLPPVIDISTGVPITLGTYKISQSVHPDLPNTTFYAYGTSQETATYPGPTLEAKQNVVSFVRFENHITDPEHIFVVDRTLHHANPPNGGVPIITHLHGGDAESKYDGHPDAWYTAAGDTGPKFVTRDNVYPNEQPASLLWYHDHTVGMTRLNVAAGLAGLYIIRSESEDPPFLPSGEFEIPLVVQDRQFFPNGSINFPDIGLPPFAHPQWCPDYTGDVILVNGKAWPYLDVQQRVYRLRILNGANSRFFTLFFSDSRLQFLQIGTDGGYLWTPILLSNITIAPAYRVDVLVDFRAVPIGSSFFLNNSHADTILTNTTTPTTNYVMKFNVVRSSGRKSAQQNVVVPSSFGPVPNISGWASTATLYRNVSLVATLPPVFNLSFLLNNAHWTDAPTETPQLYTIEIWDITHLIPNGVHPIHIHLVNFLVMHTQAFNYTRLNASECSLQLPYPDAGSCFTQAPQPPNPSEIGWKDTIIVNHGTVVRLLVPFFPRSGQLYSFDPTTFPGYVWHCHILDHEDNDMMRPLAIQPPPHA